ncbi:MAG TPA: carboxypeptidase-like regulatory domain-containing protein [Thermoanaerobaculia bacterium]|nr:carboxypeptidase-like regulatory domain-containing protein [Thermoanaerobaculia bacterium]
MRSCSGLFLLLLVVSASAEPVFITARLVRPGDTERRELAVSCVTADGSPVAQWSGSTTEKTRVDLPPGEPCRVVAVDRAIWLEPAWIVPGSAEVHLTAFAARPVSGRVREPWPKSIRLRMTRTDPASGPASAPASVDETCPFREGKFTCVAPIGVYDIAIHAPGRITEYLWAVNLAAGNGDLGTFRFREGASISGALRFADATPPDWKRVEVSATPSGVPGDTAPLVQKTRPNARGWFQIPGIAPGEYLIRARDERGAASTAERVRVSPNGQVELHDPLVLTPPRTIRARIAPPRDPWGNPWEVALYAPSPAGPGAILARSAVNAEGEWISDPLHAAEYAIAIDAPGHGTWHSERLQLYGGDVELHRDLTSYEVLGTVTLGERGVAGATGSIGGKHGAIRQEFTTGADGEAVTHVPAKVAHAKEWQVEIAAPQDAIHRVVTIEPEVDEETRRVTFTIRLPARSLVGRVVKEDGAAAANARIHVSDAAAPSSMQQLRADAEGRFRLDGLAPGSYTVSAHGYLMESETRDVVVAADGEIPPLHLTLKASGMLRGRVLSQSGPVPGAVILPVPSGVDWTLVTHARTQADGSFMARLPPGAPAADVIVAAPGFPLEIHRVLLDGRAIEVTVHQQGGALRLTVPPLTDAIAAALVLSRNDASVGVVFLLGLDGGGRIAAEHAEGVEILIPSIDYGTYTLCLVAASAGPRRCDSGFLAPGGELKLALSKVR